MSHAFSPYVYILTRFSPTGARQDPDIFTWPNVARKFIRDAYTVDGELALPPAGHLILSRHKVNQRPGQPRVIDVLNIVEFLAK
jgi:hypothetical protein